MEPRTGDSRRAGLRWRAVALLIPAIALVPSPSTAEPALRAETEVVYPAPSSPDDPRSEYFVSLLRLALERTRDDFGPATVRDSEVPIPPRRLDSMLLEGDLIDVMTSPTTRDLETRLHPVPIPLLRGIQGLRLLLIDGGRQGELDGVRSLADLRRFRVGSGVGWLDGRIFAAHGFEVQEARYESLFRMLAAGRLDVFPRGLNEVYPELDRWSKEFPGLAIEENLVLYYPLPVYFFVSPRDRALGDRIETGLRRALEDGSYEELFRSRFERALREARLEERRLFVLENADLPEGVGRDSPFWLPFLRERVLRETSTSAP